MAEDRKACSAAEFPEARLAEWGAAIQESSYYEVLGVDERAGDPELQAAYQRFARAFHPDAHVGAQEEHVRILKRVFQHGAEAYRVLKNPELRMRYDMALTRGHLRLLPSDVPPAFESSGAGRPLHELCRSAGAKLAANKAARFIDTGDLEGAKRELLIALEHDGSANPALTARIDALEVALYAMGGGADSG
ncbi:MAG TPA: DnaJ domain-containing protein [Polyangiales bacterium]|nr:DnaJ domain-containing protein [Polyangiales bacterium]